MTKSIVKQQGSTMSLKSINYYQFRDYEDFKIIFKVEAGRIDDFLRETLNEYGFTIIEKKLAQKLKITKDTILVLVKENNSKVQELIRKSPLGTNNQNLESVNPVGENGESYRFSNMAIAYYPKNKLQWELGISLNGDQQDLKNNLKIILSRVISKSLAEQNIVGLWGVPVDEGVVILRQDESLGETIWFDLNTDRIITVDGEKILFSDFKIIRLDESIQDHSVKIKSDELFSFLRTKITLLSYFGPSKTYLQNLFSLSKRLEGHKYPKENFQPRNSKSLSNAV
jgi:hypothetical protein